jgi:hypothetical protein
MTQSKMVQPRTKDIKKREKSWQKIKKERLWEDRRDRRFLIIYTKIEIMLEED